MKIIKCDICGKEFENRGYYPTEIEHYMLPLWREADNGECYITTDQADICEDCARKIADFIDEKCDTNAGGKEKNIEELAKYIDESGGCVNITTRYECPINAKGETIDCFEHWKNKIKEILND